MLLLPNEYRIEPDSVRVENIGYLPFAERPEYQALANDWHTLLDLNLPGATLLDPLMRLSALHMLLYMVRRAHEEVEDGAEPTFVLEIAAPRKTPVRELSTDNLSGNRMLSLRAIHAYIDRAKKEERPGTGRWLHDHLQMQCACISASVFLGNLKMGHPAAIRRRYFRPFVLMQKSAMANT